MIVIAECDETKRLQRSVAGRANGAQHFGHASDWASLGVEGNFDKIALGQRPCKPQQAASNRDGLEFAFGALTIFQHDEGRH